MSNPTLKSFVDRLENLDAEQKGLGTDKRDVFDEADAAGFDKKAIRRLLRDRREAAKDQGTAELAEQYRMLLSEPGATYRSVAEKTGAKKSTLHRLVPKDARGTEPPRDPNTGEIAPPEEHNEHEGLGTPDEGGGADTSGAGRQDAAEHEALARRPSGDSEGAPGTGSAEDGLIIPAFLRRARA